MGARLLRETLARFYGLCKRLLCRLSRYFVLLWLGEYPAHLGQPLALEFGTERPLALRCCLGGHVAPSFGTTDARPS